MNGFELIAEAKKQKPELTVQVVSGYSYSVSVDDSQEHYRKEMLLKPYTNDDLVQVVSSHFR